MNQVSNLLSLRDKLSSIGLVKSDGLLEIFVWYVGKPDPVRYHRYLAYDRSIEGPNGLRSVYRGIRDFLLLHVTDSTFYEMKAPALILKSMYRALRDVSTTGAILELDLRRPVDDMLAVISGHPEFMSEFRRAPIVFSLAEKRRGASSRRLRAFDPQHYWQSLADSMGIYPSALSPRGPTK